MKAMKFFMSAIIVSFAITSHAEVNVRTSPLHLLVGIVTADVDFKISDKWSLGPTAAYSSADREGFETVVYAIGLKGNYFFEGTFNQGWYLSPGIQYVSAKVTDDSSFGEIEGNASGLGVALFGGYFWMWNNFNIQLGAGPVLYTLGEISVESDDGSVKEEYAGYDGVDLGIEFTLGWKF